MPIKILRYISIIIIVAALSIFIITWIRTRTSSEYAQLKETINQIDKQENECLGKYIIDQICLYKEDTLSKKILLSSLYQNRKLFLYLQENECLPCIYNIMELLRKKNKHYLISNSLIFISTLNNTYQNLGKYVLTLPYLGLGDHLENTHSFFFELNKEGRVISIHIITNVDMERTRKYLENKHF